MSESTPLQKGSKNRLPKPHGIKGRICPIRLFHNVWVVKHNLLVNLRRNFRLARDPPRTRNKGLIKLLSD